LASSVVGERMLAVAIEADSARARVDWRADYESFGDRRGVPVRADFHREVDGFHLVACCCWRACAARQVVRRAGYFWCFRVGPVGEVLALCLRLGEKLQSSVGGCAARGDIAWM
jgi:hypothetical protein